MDSTDMKRIRENYKQLYTHKFGNLDEIDRSLKKHHNSFILTHTSITWNNLSQEQARKPITKSHILHDSIHITVSRWQKWEEISGFQGLEMLSWEAGVTIKGKHEGVLGGWWNSSVSWMRIEVVVLGIYTCGNRTMHIHFIKDNFLILILCYNYLGCKHLGKFMKVIWDLSVLSLQLPVNL